VAAGARHEAVAKKNWCVPKLTPEFRQCMEDVLDQYEKPYDPAEPVVCMDEQPYQMLDDVRPSQRAAPGKIARQDYEYRRCGTCSIFVAVEPAAGRRFVQARRHRTRSDFACFVRDLLKRYPRARRVHLVLDNLNTHNPRSLIECFGVQGASGNASPASAQVTTVVRQTTSRPKSPVGVQAVIPSGDLVRLTWDNPSLADGAGVAGFNVYRRVVDSGEFQKTTPQPTFYKIYYDDIRNPGLAGKYEYVMTAVDAFGNESVQSAPARAMAQPAK
jgi:hypothetical protein